MAPWLHFPDPSVVSPLNFPSVVHDHISSKISLGRVAGLFDAPPFPDGFVVSPLNLVAKHASQERTVIVDLSWPCGSSINDGITSGSFLGELLDLTYPTIDAIVRVACYKSTISKKCTANSLSIHMTIIYLIIAGTGNFTLPQF